ncbi:ABC transporter ATP-binding protein [Paraclostridium sp. AKS46]|nr:ABC transporter ATP-binding protein [Paraclostridium sp. AKS46]
MIKFENISKKYKKSSTNALTSMNFSIEKNEIACLLGPNGAGKTTIIKCISGLIIPDSGKIFIHDKEVNFKNKNHLKSICTVLEGARNLYWRVSVRSNLYYFAALKGKSRKEVDNNIQKYKELFNIDHLLDKQVSTLSLGQKQIVSIMIPIILEPKILILDEPSNGLDIDVKNRLAELINNIKQNMDITIIIASHDVDFIRKIVDKIIIINNGEVKNVLDNNGLTNSIIEEKYYDILNV